MTRLESIVFFPLAIALLLFVAISSIVLAVLDVLKGLLTALLPGSFKGNREADHVVPRS